MSKQREAMQFALEALEDIFGKNKIDVTAINMLREALAEPELEFWPGDVLICKEDGTKVTVANGNRGPLQLRNGKIAVAWDDNVGGEYTIEQIKEMFYQEEKPEPEQEPVAWRIADERDWEYRTKPPLETDTQWSARYGRKYEPLYLSPPTRKPEQEPVAHHYEDSLDMVTAPARKPLTEPELHAIEPTWPNEWNYDDVLKFVRTIERAHGIGGEK